MTNILRSALPSTALPIFSALALLSLASTSEAAWPRYRVSAGYSLPSAPAMRPMFVPVYPTDRYLQANPGVVPATYGAPSVPNVMVPGTIPNATIPAANLQPSLLAPPQISVPNTSYYPQTYNAPGVNQPAYTPYSYNTPATTSYYAPPAYNPPAVQPYQAPRPIQPYTGAVQPYGAYYQPTRPSTFYSPTPSYYPQQPVFGQY